MDWFEKYFGFVEQSPEQVRRMLTYEAGYIHSSANGRRYRAGTLRMPSLGELRQQTAALPLPSGKLRLTETVADVQGLHRDPATAGAVFQVASQFNLLEMVSPEITPEAGVARYAYDRTQGPACAIACGAGTVYRNYFVPLGGQIGQSQDRQIDTLHALGTLLGNADGRFWWMQNGYALADRSQLHRLNARLEQLSPEAIKAALCVGIQEDTEVILSDDGHTVSQVYGSALPVAYNDMPPRDWAVFAQLILEASYEATFHVAAQNYARTQNPSLYLTLLGGGVFGNDQQWIRAAIEASLERFAALPLEVHLVSYGKSNPLVAAIIEKQKGL